MKRIKRVVDTSFWSDEKVLDFSPEDKYFMLYLLTNQHTTQLGIYHLAIKKASFDLGYTQDSVRVLIERFQNKYGIIRYSESTSEIAIKNYLLYSIVSGGKPVLDCLLSDLEAVRDKSLLTFVYNSLIKKDIANVTAQRFLTLLKESINDNDNDNESIVGVSSYDSSHDSSEPPTPPKPSKHKYGEFNHVLLLDSEYEKLGLDYGEDMRAKAIIFLDEYIEEKGAKYKSHYMAIRRWVVNAVKERESKGKPDYSKNKFNQMIKSNYDFDAIEKEILQ